MTSRGSRVSVNDGLTPSYQIIDTISVTYSSAGKSGSYSANLYIPQYKVWTVETMWEWPDKVVPPGYSALTRTPFAVWMFPAVRTVVGSAPPVRTPLAEPKQIWPYRDIYTHIFSSEDTRRSPDLAYSQDNDYEMEYYYQFTHWSASLQSDMGTIYFKLKLTEYQ